MTPEEMLSALKIILNEVVDPLRDDVKRLDAKIDGVEQRLNTRIDGVEQRLDARIHSLETRLSAPIAEGDRLTLEAAKDLSRELKTIKAKLNRMNADYADIPARLDDFEARFERLEKQGQ